jgi:hypothetical protein
MKILNRNYEKVIGRTRQMAGLVRRELKSSVARTVPLAARLRMMRRGFLSESYVLYNFERNDPALYLTDLSRFVRTFHINRSPHLLDDKFVFAVMLDSLECQTAPLRALVGQGQFMSTDSGRRLDEASVLELVRLHGELVVKPRFGGGGGKIRFLRLAEGALVVNNQPMTFHDFVRVLRQEQHVVTDRIYQHDYAARVYADSTNTIRIVTMIDVDRGMPFIAAAVHRFGTAASFPVDNWSKGGISAPVDLESGTLGAGATFPGRHATRMHHQHPDSGAEIAGIHVPHWPEIRDGVLRLAARMPLDNPYVGWDVIVTRDSFVVLEGNRYSDVNLLQVHRPLLVDERTRAFFHKYGAA